MMKKNVKNSLILSVLVMALISVFAFSTQETNEPGIDTQYAAYAMTGAHPDFSADKCGSGTTGESKCGSGHSKESKKEKKKEKKSSEKKEAKKSKSGSGNESGSGEAKKEKKEESKCGTGKCGME